MGFNSGFKGLNKDIRSFVQLCFPPGKQEKPRPLKTLVPNARYNNKLHQIHALLHGGCTEHFSSDIHVRYSSRHHNCAEYSHHKLESSRDSLIHLIFMDPCIIVWLSRNTNKMQLCNRIYYSKVYWRLNMFLAAHRSSSGALNCICSLWFIYTCGDRPLSRLNGQRPLSLDNGRSPHGYINQRLQIQFRAPDDEQCAARNMLSLQ